MPGDMDAWRELGERAVEPNPFFHPDFVVPAAELLTPGRVAILSIEGRDGWAAALPVIRGARWRDVVGPGLSTWLHDYCFLGTPLLAPDDTDAGARALLGLGRRDTRSAYLALDWVRVGGQVEASIEQALMVEGVDAVRVVEFERALVLRRPEATYAEDRLSARHRKELRRQWRSLGAQLGETPAVLDRSEDPGAYEEFVRLEAAGWKGRTGTALGSREGHARLFLEICHSFARRGCLQILSLEVAGRLAAMQCNLRAGEGLFCFKVAYDEKLARYSPGVHLELTALEVFHEKTDAAWMDSCAPPDAELINRLWPDRVGITTLVVPAAGPLGRTVRPAVRSVRAARRVRDALRGAAPTGSTAQG